MKVLIPLLCGAAWLAAAERRVDPTWLHRHVPSVETKPFAVTTASCRYKPVFGEGADNAGLARGVARFAEIRVDAAGACLPAAFPDEQAVVILEGSGTLLYGEEKAPLRKHDFFYLPPNTRYALQAAPGVPLAAIVMGFRVPGKAAPPPPRLLIANMDDVKKEVVGNHPPSTLYQLLMGGAESKRDRIAAGQVLTSLFVMNFAPGGTNFPHHHDREEEIYLVLEGAGEMVAGGGADGIEGRRPAKAGDAYFFRLNCTVGFYNGSAPARILAVRSLYPFRR